MNNIFLNQDPILGQYQQPVPQYQYPPMPPIPPVRRSERNWIDELDIALKSLTPETIAKLSSNNEWNELNAQLSSIIRDELMSVIRARLVGNMDVNENARKQLSIIHDTECKLKDEERQNLNELNDYMKNYSHLTFDEYRKIKSDNNEN